MHKTTQVCVPNEPKKSANFQLYNALIPKTLWDVMTFSFKIMKPIVS